MDARIEFLKSIPYFSGLSPAELDAISKSVFETVVGKGEIILLEGESTGVLYLVVSGAVKVFSTSPEGKEQILSITRPGESFNDVPVFDGGPNPASAQAMMPVVLYGIRTADLETSFREHPEMARNVIKVLAGRLRQLMLLVEDLSFRPVISRVAKVLLEQAGDAAGSPPHLTQQEMAALVGTAREMIGRSLKVLEDEKAIRLDRHRIVITNKQALKDVAGVST